MQLRAKMSFRLRAVIFKAITMDGCNKTSTFEHNFAGLLLCLTAPFVQTQVDIDGMCGCGTQAVGVISCAVGFVIMFEWQTQLLVVNVAIHTPDVYQ